MKKELALIGIALILVLSLVFAGAAFHIEADPSSSGEQTVNGSWFLDDSADKLYVNDSDTGFWVLSFTYKDEDFDQIIFDIEILSDYDKDGATGKKWVYTKKELQCDSDIKFADQGYQTLYVKPTKVDSELVSIQIKMDCDDDYTGTTIHNISVKFSDKFVSLYKKIRRGGVPINLKAMLESDKTGGDPPLAVKFNITKSIASEGNELEKYELDFGDGSAKVEGDWPTDAAELEKLKSIAHTYEKNATAKLTITEKSTGEKSSAEISIAVAKPPECETILQCLAELDKKFVEGVFED